MLDSRDLGAQCAPVNSEVLTMAQYLLYAGMVLSMILAFAVLPVRKPAKVHLGAPNDRARFGDTATRAPGIR